MRIETIDITAAAGDDIISKFQVTFRFRDAVDPISASIDGVDVDQRLAIILFRAITGPQANRR